MLLVRVIIKKYSKNIQKMFKKNQRTHSKVAEHTDMKLRYIAVQQNNILMNSLRENNSTIMSDPSVKCLRKHVFM